MKPKCRANRLKLRVFASALFVFLVLWLAACSVGPVYNRPVAQAPNTWKTEGPWQAASPADAIPKGKWWQFLGDLQLNAYEEQLLLTNQSLTAARERLLQAKAQAQVSSAAYFPQLNAEPDVQRQRLSGNRPLSGSTPPLTPVTQNVLTLPFALNYEVDLFGRVRLGLEAANASFQSAAADLQNSLLVLTAELAADYISLRELDAEENVIRELVAIQQRGLDLVESRHHGGIASGLELAQQASLLDSTRTQLSLLQQQRDQFEHAISALTGNPASTFSVPVNPLRGTPPAVPLGAPSDVLQRRPDIAVAERAMAFENAQVGIATTAFYPHITLFGNGGYQSRDVSNLATAPSVFWALGADLLQPIFNGGLKRANLAAARAAYDESVANYRQTVLTAFQQVEDCLSGLNALDKALATQQAAVDDSRLALEIANSLYVGGAATYLDVITSQAALLSNQRLATQLLGQQMITSILLVKALGGGWDASAIQNERVRPRAVQAVQP